MAQNISDIWSEVLNLLEEETTAIGFNTWIKTITPGNTENGTFTLYVPNTVNKNMVEGRYKDLIRNSILILSGDNYDINVEIKEEGREPKQKEASSVKTYGIPLNKKYTFDSFVVGESNRFAHAASLAVAESPAISYNPLFLYSGVGLGKTHLLHAIGNYILENNPDAKIAYISSETFLNEFITAMRDNTTNDFKDKYRSMDILMVDDIQFIAGKDKTEEEFFHTFNTLYDSNKQIIITSDKPPQELKNLEERLRSRFEWGITANIGLPDYETRVAILQKKVQLEGITISNDILSYIAEKITSNIRELEGGLNKVLAYRGLVNKEITMEVAMEALQYYEQNLDAKVVTPDIILNSCASFYNIRKDDILGNRRTKEIAYARQICMYLFRELLGYSLLKVANYFGKDHTTVMYAVSKIEKEMKNDISFKTQIEVLKDDILN
ncbi:MAG: chromosomal replication initiator protein DnaA [Clostridia bacterium]|nr:chromosomal replication initiator protein DnaA [Clostridia bacterium]